jgi:glycerophosphoryl diester phosphodiesterase
MVTSGSHHSPEQSLRAHIEERFLASKTGNPDDNEDAIHVSASFVAVIDGATPKTPRLWGGRTGGQEAARLLSEALGQLPGDATIHSAVRYLTESIRSAYEQANALAIVRANPVERMAASLAVASLHRREIWLIGDCACIVGGKRVTNRKLIDRILADARAAFLESELQAGKSLEDLRKRDTGRQFIYPLLERQTMYQNNADAGVYEYAALDGFPIPHRHLRVCRLPPPPTSVVLATDGYPVVRETLATSEETLKRIVTRDPLLMRQYKSTKGVQAGNLSYDDRAYIRFTALSDDGTPA